MSKSCPFLVLASLKYCAEKRLLKTHVAFFMKVTVVHHIGDISYCCLFHVSTRMQSSVTGSSGECERLFSLTELLMGKCSIFFITV